MAFVTANGIRHHLAVLGDEPGDGAVLCLHGLVMDNLSSWYFTAGTRLAATRRVITLDLRGHGRSERPATGYAIGDFEADVLGVLDALGHTGPVDLLGNSFGGQLAATIAAHHPHRVRRLVLVDSHLGREGWGDAMAASLSRTGADRDAAIATHFASWLGRHAERKRTRLAETASALVHGSSLVADLQASPPLDDAALSAITADVTALYGEASDVRDEADRLQRCVPGAAVRIFPAATHSLLWEQTGPVVDAITEALAP